MLSNQTKVHLVDPRSHNNRRCEIKLDDACYASDLVLVDYGFEHAREFAATRSHYGLIVGALSAGASLTLRSGGVVIDQARDITPMAALKAVQTSNAGSQDINRVESLNALGFSVDQLQKVSLNPSHVDWSNLNDGNQFHISTGPNAANPSEPHALIHLRELLPFLESVEVLNNIPDLSLTIEWNLAHDNVSTEANEAAWRAGASVIRPTLIATEILGVEAPKEQRIPYLRRISERLRIPAAQDGVVQAQAFESKAFKGKVLKDLAILNVPTVQPAGSRLIRQEKSLAQLDEKIQLVVNSKKFLPGDGVTSGAQKLAHVNYTASPINMVLPAILPAMGVPDELEFYGDAVSAELTGSYSPFAVEINQPIDRLEVEYQRLGDAIINKLLEPLDMFLYGRVYSELQVTPMGVKVSS